ncbi:MAG TPA: nitroreductase family protein [Bacteroidales bacterium]|jgi:nitroreductase/NAD-dependent dihydropyrimidine dehydrogenase PreA subunit|nr:nitroreductase family protein [Bacteroidales bacterium]HOS73146.1 nitroreductase family protein [Bacteroidales bacterium]HQH23736.1 nitroreductase family protein [Bacteroidales bacterium]HQJ83407.1 nitroreductase family protein [Bacteroidales bacterium]
MNIRIDYDLCTRCDLCSRVCGSRRIIIADDKRPVKLIEAGCNDCGHCIAICPVNAIVNTRTDMSAFTAMTDPDIRYEQFSNLVRNRRSIRNYRKQPLKQEHIDKLMEVARYIPSGSNKQLLKYRFITDETLLQEIKTEMADKMRMVLKLSASFPVRYFVKDRSKSSASRLVKLFFEDGVDTFLRGAPCLLVIYTEQKYFRIPQWDAGIAANTIDLAAQTLGIGTLMNGYFVELANRFKSVRKLVRLNGREQVLTALCLGYPSVRYKRTVYRRPPEISNL